MMQYRLKVCPKCKKNKHKHYGQNINLVKIGYPKFFKKYVVKCFDCGTTTKRTFTMTVAIKLWNRRKVEYGNSRGKKANNNNA